MKIYLSPLTEYKLEKLLNYLESEWGKSVRQKFLRDFEKKTRQILDFPLSNPKVDEFDDILKCVITSQASFYYRILNNEVEIISLTDNRQNPKKVMKEIRQYFKS